MTAPILRLHPDGQHRVIAPPAPPQRLGDILVRLGALAPDRLSRALALQRADRQPIGQILRAREWTSAGAIEAGLALQRGAARVDLLLAPPDLRLVDLFGADRCLRLGIVPWKRAGAATIVAVEHPDRGRERRAELEAALGPVRFAIATGAEIEAAILDARRASLARAAEHRVPAAESVRGLGGRIGATALALVALLLLGLLAAPGTTLALLAGWAVLALLATTGLRAAAAVAQLAAIHGRRPGFASSRTAPAATDLPVVSVLVPLYREREIAGRLLDRLSRLDYPDGRLDICLAVEADDRLTIEALDRTALPPRMRRIVVPPGTVRTKPRALNYALPFCRGAIVGVYDAEDAPAPDQIRRVALRFRDSPPEVACLQGVLDFYNARANWLSRCFAIDYATWFRIVLPGLARLGLVLPLGGTTLFFRRAALERLGGWDSHNVTEDADLGLRLARHGYRCELLDSVTEEEATCRPLPWVRQRSRWLKGYAMTWISHMRRPGRLLRDLGWRRFLGVQVLFLGTLSCYVLAPLLWSFWVLVLGLPHPVAGVVPWSVVVALGSVFLLCEIVNVAAGALAVSTPKHRWLIPWVPTMLLYHPLGALASWKALVELVVRPFYWDKTEHGVSGPDRPSRRAPPEPRRA